jgi:hypothetical protein
MNVFRHHHVTDQRKVIPFPNLSQNLKKETACPLGPQQRLAPIATAGNEVQVTQSVAAFETVFHSHLAPFANAAKDAAPALLYRGCG